MGRELIRIVVKAVSIAVVLSVVGGAAAQPPSSLLIDGLSAAYPPLGATPFPLDNRYTPAKAKLGWMLFFDPILSGNGSQSCASCHNPSLSWSDGLPAAIGDAGTATRRRSPTLLGVARLPLLGWAGQYTDLEAVTWTAISSHKLQDLPQDEALARVAAIAGYRRAFAEAFGSGAPTPQRISMALATYERTIVAAPAPFDRWLDGDEDALGAAAKRGFALFNGQARCADCHSGRNFTDGSFHDIGHALGDDIGRGALVPTAPLMSYAFKTPTLRDVARRAPYMHDGSIPTLAGVIELYNRGGVDRPSRSSSIYPLGLTAGERADLTAFLETLTGTAQPVSVPVLPR